MNYREIFDPDDYTALHHRHYNSAVIIIHDFSQSLLATIFLCSTIICGNPFILEQLYAHNV
jgi:hypothetical protein